MKSDAHERHYVLAGRLATVLLFAFSCAVVFLLDSAKGAFDLVLQIGAGTGPLYLVRWFWWRVNAWCEVVAMASSFVVSAVFLVLSHRGTVFSTHVALVITVFVTTSAWMAAAFLAPQTSDEVLVRFYERVRPFGPGWARVRKLAGIPADDPRARGNIPLALCGWVSGCVLVWSSLFSVGNWLYGRTFYATIMTACALASGLVLITVVRRLWAETSHDEGAAAEP
ncbi:hypothetical protein [Labilithrix luteola]|uniref:hypothetical protein n=1 Tax=Labilithrix luteola TaxID=1391654 RepID=UPI00196A1210|nr:hypothetical protein [Labilithrix luteola]